MKNLREFYEQVCTWILEASSAVFQFVVGLFTKPIRTLYPPLNAFSVKWYQFQDWFIELWPKDRVGRSWGTTWVLAFVILFSFSMLFRPWGWEFVKPNIPASCAGLIAGVETMSHFTCAYFEFLGDPFSVLFAWGSAFFKNTVVSAGLKSATSSLLHDFGVVSLLLGLTVKSILSAWTWITATIHIPFAWMVTLKTAVLGVGRVIQIFDMLCEINTIIELLPNIPIYKNWFTEFVHESVNDYYEWYVWERILRVRTGRKGEQPITLRELQKGENKGHKLVQGGSRLDQMRIFGIQFRGYATVLANANLKLCSWFCEAYGTGKILTF